MSQRSEVEKFFSTLLLGDFEEDQSTSAQIVGGLISLIPVLDQVLDARDITGTLFRINRAGGFKNATSDQLVNLGFAAFGAIPEVGSAFKTVFKPLWKERRAIKGAVNGGLEAVEGMLHMRKGSAMRWIQGELLGKWPTRTTAAIAAVEAGLEASIALLDFLGSASGWKDWLIPDPIQVLSRELLPGLKSLRSQIRQPLQRASDEIYAFLEDLMGEQAAQVVMAAGQRAVAASAMSGTRTRSGHNKADAQPRGREPERQQPREVQDSRSTTAKSGGGPVHAAVQRTIKGFKELAINQKGLIGEHMADYQELERLGGSWPHDEKDGIWSPDNVRKVNSPHRPINLHPRDLAQVNHRGIDSVWVRGRDVVVLEAKMRENKYSVKAIGRARESSGNIPKLQGVSDSIQILHYLLTDYEDKGGVQLPMVQMSKRWVVDRARGEGLSANVIDSIDSEDYARRVVLVTVDSDGALDHVQALVDIYAGNVGVEIHPHDVHGSTEIWDGQKIDAVEDARKRARSAKGVKGDDSASDKSRPKPGKKPRK